MTYLEKYLEQHKCTIEDFEEDQVDYDGFCPDDMSGDKCIGLDCTDCWNREIKLN